MNDHPNFDPFSELPEGFAMALAKDPSALAAFGRLPAQERAGYVSRAHRAASRGEMQSIIVELGTHSTF